MNKRSGIESKKRILAAAIKTFSERGYKGTSMRMIGGGPISAWEGYIYISGAKKTLSDPP